MGETVIVETGQDDPGAVAAAALLAAESAGTSKAVAEQAEREAAEAKVTAESAELAARLALEHNNGVDEARARQVAREESERYLLELEELRVAAEPAPAPAKVDVVVSPQVVPKSVTKANRSGGERHKLTFGQRYLGFTDDGT